MIKHLIITAAMLASLHGQPCPPERSYPDDHNVRHSTADVGVDIRAFADLCKRVPQAVACAGSKGHRLLTFSQVANVDSELRSVFAYRDDRTTSGKDDSYDNWTICGDCEDYALTLAELLSASDQSVMWLQFELLCDAQDCGGHATLWVLTLDRGIVEVDVNGSPRAPDPNEGHWECVILMNGERQVAPFAGKMYDGIGCGPMVKR